jgi:outer membrane protein assembly factor BamA
MRFSKYILLLTVLVFFVRCQPNKYVSDGNYILVKNVIEAKGAEFSDREYQNFIRQKPNKKIFGFWKFHMGLYNLSNPEKDTPFHNWLRKIGEEPVLYDGFQASKSKTQISTFLYNKGYHNPVIRDSLSVNGFKARHYYIIDPGKPMIVRNLSLFSSDLIQDKRIGQLLAPDSASFQIQPGDRFDKDVLQNERKRLTANLKEMGYYDFSKEYIWFEADTFSNERLVDLRLGIKPLSALNADGQFLGHKQFRINEIRVVGDFDPLTFMRNPQDYFMNTDTIEYNGLEFISRDRLSVKKNLLYSSIYFAEGDLFKQSTVDKTNRTLNRLQNFRTINFRFEPIDSMTSDSTGLLNCLIELSPMTKQSYDISLEGTHSSGNLGMAGNLIYNHRNLFRGAENFELKFRGAIEFLANANSDINQMIEFGVQTRLNVPQFWLPVELELFQKKYTPRTNLTFNYNYQLRPEITRTIASAGFGYQWKSSTLYNHAINLIDLNYVNVTQMSDRFREQITGTYLEDSYRSHVIPALNYSFTFSDQDLTKQRNSFFLNFRPEIAGNLFNLVSNISGAEKSPEGYLFFNTPYSQYIMSDIDFRYKHIPNDANLFVFRFFAGAGYPYGNAEVMPFEKRYYSGGSNGIRAWQVRSLGPGSYVLPDGQEDLYPNQLGDVKLETNVEYRFDLFWSLKGAVFIDAGNIWTLQSDETLVGGDFAWNRFYKEIAMGTGAGLRIDLSFVVARLDLGMKVRDPSVAANSGWLPFTRKLEWQDFMLNFAIGYPF